MKTRLIFCFTWCVLLTVKVYGGVIVVGGERTTAQLATEQEGFGPLTWCAVGVVAVSWLFPKLLNK